jgi:hypothetical protein
VASEYIPDSLVDIKTKWSIDDAADAHDVLDYLDALHEESRTKH